MQKVLERKNIDDRFKWDLSALVEDDDVWEQKLKKYVALALTAAEYEGKLSDDDTLLKFLKFQDEVGIELGKLYVYAHMSADVDLSHAKYKEMSARIDNQMVTISAATSFATPEICKRSEKKLLELSKNPDFADYSYMLADLAKNKKYVLSAKEEKLLSEVGNFSDGFHDAFMMFDNADIKFDKVRIKGKEVELSHGVYSVLLQNKDKSVRKAAFDSMFGAYKQNINTIAALYGGNVVKDWFFAKVRGYNSCLEKALIKNDVEPDAYRNLIKSVKDNLAPMHKYVAFRKKALGGGTLNMCDLYVSIVDGVDIALPYDKATKLVKEALAPMGEEYGKLLDEAFCNKWIDVYENKNKRSGAYSWGTYGAHPNVLLNYQETSHDVFTIAHELGHSMHSYFSNQSQPFAKSDYVIFVAEIASTVNEVLLLKHLLKTADTKTRKYLLSYYLDMFRTTLFRQTMFAEFELEAHKLAESDTPITPDALCDIYWGLNKKYYGAAVKHDDLIKYEWARIPHFYRSFYVYQYATGLTAAVSIANDILKNGDEAYKRYKRFLSAGGSMPPLDILRLAGVDLATEAPFKTAMKEFSDTLAELKRIF